MLSLTTYGRINLPPLIFLHGFLGCKEDWEPIALSLQDTFYCICLDLPGHGNSAFTEDVLGCLHQVLTSFPKAPVVGYSLGGRIALMLQDLYPDLFSYLILISSHPGLQTEEERKQKEEQEAVWINILEKYSVEEFLHRWYDQPLFASIKNNPHLYQALLEKRKKQDPKALAFLMRSLSLAKQKAFRYFSSPTVFFYGEADTKYAALYKTMQTSIKAPSMMVEKISRSGHAAHLENPEECVQKIKSYLCEVAACNN